MSPAWWHQPLSWCSESLWGKGTEEQLWEGSLCAAASSCSAESPGHRATPNTQSSATSAENPREGMWKVGPALGGRKWGERKSLAKVDGDACTRGHLICGSSSSTLCVVLTTSLNNQSFFSTPARLGMEYFGAISPGDVSVCALGLAVSWAGGWAGRTLMPADPRSAIPAGHPIPAICPALSVLVGDVFLMQIYSICH